MTVRKPDKTELRQLRRRAIHWADIRRVEYMLNGLDRKTCRRRLAAAIKAGRVKRLARGLYVVC